MQVRFYKLGERSRGQDGIEESLMEEGRNEEEEEERK